MKKRLLSLLCLAVISVQTLTGCGNNSSKSAEGTDTPVVKIAIPTNGNYENVDKVEEAIDERLKEAGVNAKLDITYLNWGNYEQQVNLMLTNPDEVDLVYTYGTLQSRVSSGMVLDLTDYWEKAGEGIKEYIPEWVIEGSKMGGKLYIIPCNVERSHEATFVANKQLCQELGIELDEDKIYTLDEVHDMLEEAHEAYPEVTTLVPQSANALIPAWDWENMGESNNIGVIEDYGTTDEVISITECESFLELANTMREWYQEGLIMQDINSNTESMQSAVETGAAFGEFTDGFEPKGQSDEEGFTRYMFTVVPNWVNSSAGVRMGYCINAQSQHPDESFQVLEQLYSNQDIQALLGYGIEGENYIIQDDGRANFPEGVTMETDTYTTVFANWPVVPNADCGFVPYYFQTDRFDLMKEYDKNAVEISHALGCSFDSSAVVDQYAACVNVVSKYYNAILSGSVDVETTLEKFKEELKAAGEEEVIAEKQRQLDEFLSDK